MDGNDVPEDDGSDGDVPEDDGSDGDVPEDDGQEDDGSDGDVPDEVATLIAGILAGEQRALARAITRIENRAPGYRTLVSRLHDHTGGADVIGITGAPGAGKSTLVDKLAAAYRDRGETVGVVAVDPSSPYTGGAVLGDRIRMGSNVGDMEVFFRSMSARGQLGGLSMATADAVKALDAFGKDVVIIETVGAGQNEVDVVRTADTVAVLVQPGSGDDVQTLKAGILEIGDVFVVNKADTDGVERTVAELEEMVHRRRGPTVGLETGHHGADAIDDVDDSVDDSADDDPSSTDRSWTPPVLRTVGTTGEGVDELIETFDAHATYLHESGELAETHRTRYAEEIRTLVRSDLGALATVAIERRGGIEALADRVRQRETDPYAIATAIVEPIAACVEERADDRHDEGRTDAE